MNKQFDELTKSLAQSVTRRGALKKFGVGLAGLALVCFGLVNKARAAACKAGGSKCSQNSQCCTGNCYFELPFPGDKNNGSKFGTCTYF
jgi:hypothetical protein